jgi:hypothetical protein
MESNSLGQPVPFIEIELNPEEKTYYFNINPYAITILQEMKDRKVYSFSN